MKLIEALEILRRPEADAAPRFEVFLACGFTPLHLQTFLTAELRCRLREQAVAVKTGLFGDLAGNIERLDAQSLQSLAVMIEWSDLDPRLGARTLGGWLPAELAGILDAASSAATRLQRALIEVSARVPVVVCMPTLPLPPMFPTRLDQAGLLETGLRELSGSLAHSLAAQGAIRVVNPQFLDSSSVPGQRYDVKSDVTAGFPYTLHHASALAELFADLIQPRPPKKGLITDLDDTLWAGIVGDDGVDGISWHLDRHTQMHGLYQQLVASLAGAGVLVAVASKNDPAIVARAFQREDLLLSKNQIFPFEVHWQRKSESVQRILQTWNIAPDAVEFVDDSPMEVAEVRAAFPEMECLVFPKNDYQGVWDLLKHLRDAFGKALLTEEDTMRLRSIRDGAAWREAGSAGEGSADDFLKSAGAAVTFDAGKSSEDIRAFELVNKTNQFNLNGKRFSDAEWKTFLSDPAAFLLTASYKDKFGRLGKIAVVLGKVQGRTAKVASWVMSCRAFSRRIEYQCLKHLFDTWGVDEIEFEYQTTDRNGPLQEFLTEFVKTPLQPGMRLTKEQFDGRVPQLFHHVERVAYV
jgi:FkbH-like protein